MVTPTPAAPPVSATLNLTYTLPLAQGIDPLALDVYAPAAKQNRPVVVFLHGTGESKRFYVRPMRTLAEQGLVVYAADWPVWVASRAARDDGRGFREIVETLACAVRYARATAADYGGDRSRLTLVGFSAGAAMGASLAFAGDEPERAWAEFAAERGAPPQQVKCAQSGDSAHVDAFVGVGGAYGLGEALQKEDPRLWQLVSVTTHIVARRNLRVRLLHGAFDTLVPIERSMQFAETLSQAGYDARFVRFDRGHVVPETLVAEEILKLWQ